MICFSTFSFREVWNLSVEDLRGFFCFCKVKCQLLTKVGQLTNSIVPCVDRLQRILIFRWLTSVKLLLISGFRVSFVHNISLGEDIWVHFTISHMSTAFLLDLWSNTDLISAGDVKLSPSSNKITLNSFGCGMSFLDKTE